MLEITYISIYIVIVKERLPLITYPPTEWGWGSQEPIKCTFTVFYMHNSSVTSTFSWVSVSSPCSPSKKIKEKSYTADGQE